MDGLLENLVCGDLTAGDGRTDPFAAEGASEAGSVPCEEPAISCRTTRCSQSHRISMAAKRLEHDVFRQASLGTEAVEQSRISLVEGATFIDTAQADIEEISLGEDPGVAVEVFLEDKLGNARCCRDPRESRCIQKSFAFAGHHHRFILVDFAQLAGDGAAVSPRTDKDGRTYLSGSDRKQPRSSVSFQGIDTGIGSDGGSGGRSPLQKVVVELAADDAVADGMPPSSLVDTSLKLQCRAREGLEGPRIVSGRDPEGVPDGSGDPAGAELDAGEYGLVENQNPSARGCERVSGCGPGRAAANDDDVVSLHSDFPQKPPQAKLFMPGKGGPFQLVGDAKAGHQVALNINALLNKGCGQPTGVAARESLAEGVRISNDNTEGAIWLAYLSFGAVPESILQAGLALAEDAHHHLMDGVLLPLVSRRVSHETLPSF